MAGKRKPISASLRWQVFARDGFQCRYCGVQAGEDGVDLAVDHIRSVADGGDNRIDNLATACRTCNSGKGARSLKDAPTTSEVIGRIEDRTHNLQAQSVAIHACITAQSELNQQIINMKCQGYGRESVHMSRGEATTIGRLCTEFGADAILEWYSIADANDVQESDALRYLNGIARNTRKDAAE